MSLLEWDQDKIKKLNEIVNTFEKIGYDVSYKILDDITLWSDTI